MLDPIKLFIELTIHPDKFDDDLREYCENETEAQGFPISPENTAWMYAQMIADDACGMAVDAEVAG